MLPILSTHLSLPPKATACRPPKKFHPHLRKFKAKHLNTWYRMFVVVFTCFVLNLHEIGCSLRGWQIVDRGGSSILLHKFYQLFITLPVHQTIWWSFNIISSAIFIFFAKIALNSTRLLKGFYCILSWALDKKFFIR